MIKVLCKQFSLSEAIRLYFLNFSRSNMLCYLLPVLSVPFKPFIEKLIFSFCPQLQLHISSHGGKFLLLPFHPDLYPDHVKNFNQSWLLLCLFIHLNIGSLLGIAQIIDHFHSGRHALLLLSALLKILHFFFVYLNYFSFSN